MELHHPRCSYPKMEILSQVFGDTNLKTKLVTPYQTILTNKNKKMKNILVFTVFTFSLIPAFLTAQNFVPSIPIEDSLDNEYVLPDVLQSGTNYLIEVSVNWCGWCKVELKKWKECYQEWEDNYNLEVFVLSADGIEPEDKQNMLDWFIDEELEYHLYFANNDTVVNHLGIQGYPTNFLVNDQGINFECSVLLK